MFAGTLATKVVLLRAAGPRVQRGGRATQRLVRDLVHAGTALRVTGGLQRPVHRLADHRERAGGAHHQGAPGRPARGRQGGDAAVAAGACCTWAGATTSGWAGTTTCASTPTTTPSTRARSGPGWTWPPTWTPSGSGTAAGCSPSTQRRWARGMTVTDPAHVTAPRALRQAYQHPVSPPGASGPGAGPGRLRQGVRHRRRAAEATMSAKTAPDRETLKQITHLAAGPQGAPDHRVRRPAGRPRPRRRLDPRGLPGRGPRTGGRRPQRLRCPAADPRRRVPRGQDDRRLRLRPPTRRPHPDPGPGLRRLPGRAPQRRPPRPARHRQDPPGHRARRRRLPARAPGAVRHRHRLGHPPRARPTTAAAWPPS